MNRRLSWLVAVVCVAWVRTSPAADWPMWRHDAGRSGVSPAALADELHLHWVRELPEPQPAWPASQTKLQFDRSYQPVVMGRRLFVGSTVNDSISAYDTRTGNELWQFYTEGPVRFAPVADGERVFAVSDDGHLYCLYAGTGKLLWKVNGGPAKRLVIGNDRLVSTWPARGGVVLADGVLYFTASIWPSMGIFIHAVDAETGQILWTNSETGSLFTVHPHGAASFGSIVPQGYLALAGDYLVVPGGRSLPAVFERKTGKLVHFQFGGKSGGGFEVMAGGDCYAVGGELFQLKDGMRLASLDAGLMSSKECVGLTGGTLKIQSLDGEIKTKLTIDRKGKPQKTVTFTPRFQRSIDVDADGAGEIFCRAGDRIYLGGKNRIAAVDLPNADTKERIEPAWALPLNENPTAMLAADDRLFVVTEANKLYCYGPEQRPASAHILEKPDPQVPSAEWVAKAKPYLEASPSKAGYALALGVGSGRLIEQIILDTNLQVIALETEREQLDQLRQRMDERGLYGTRLSALEAEFASHPLPPYLADLIFVEDSALTGTLIRPGSLSHIYQTLRPFGGVLVFPATEEQHSAVRETIEQNAERFPKAILERNGALTLLRRVGALPGAGDWTHQYGDATNSVVSKDQLVKAPLGVLWFGGPSNDKVLPRHGHGPAPQVAGGRLVIEGPDMLRAVDVYTGRVHWEKDLPGVGEYYDVTRHFSGAGEVGSNYVTLSDRVYVIHDGKILELDARTGETAYAYELPEEENQKSPGSWGFVAWADGRLVATSSPVKVAGVGDSAKSTSKASIPKGFTAIIKPHAEWHYLAGKDPAADWMAGELSLTNWKNGAAGFGYGDDDDRTVLKDMQNRYTRVYIRKELDGRDLQNVREVSLAINYDDAFIAYFNGREIVRAGVGKGSGQSASKLKSHEAKGYETFPLRDFQKLVKPGKNVLAIEGHNTDADSSDFTLDPYLVAKTSAAQPSKTDDAPETAAGRKRIADLLELADKASASRRLVVFDAKTRKPLWSRDAVYGFRHNSIVVTGDRVFCIDSLSPEQFDQLKRRGLNAADEPRLLALDARTGEELWSTTEDVFGTFLNYSAEHDVLLQAGSAYRDRAADEVGTGMVAYRGSTGEVLWKDLKLTYNGPCLLWRDKVITNGASGFQLDLLDGKKTGWKFSRMYGCNTVIGGEHLLTFRSGAAGFCDLTGDSGTGNLGGFRASCTSNLIPADGVLNAPDYTRTCVCAYQNQTSVAWIHMPDADFWTFSSLDKAENLERVGLNLGAPGDRRSEEGTLWFDYPTEGGPSPDLDVSVDPGDIRWYSHHASEFSGQAAWISASGGEGLRKLTLKVPEALKKQKSWTVRLYFAEPEEADDGSRAFSIQLQGELVADKFNIAQEADGVRKTFLKEYENIEPSSQLTLTLSPLEGSSREPVISGIEIVPAK